MNFWQRAKDVSRKNIVPFLMALSVFALAGAIAFLLPSINLPINDELNTTVPSICGFISTFIVAFSLFARVYRLRWTVNLNALGLTCVYALAVIILAIFVTPCFDLFTNLLDTSSFLMLITALSIVEFCLSKPWNGMDQVDATKVLEADTHD